MKSPPILHCYTCPTVFTNPTSAPLRALRQLASDNGWFTGIPIGQTLKPPTAPKPHEARVDECPACRAKSDSAAVNKVATWLSDQQLLETPVPALVM
jgi:hypothetical protein